MSERLPSSRPAAFRLAPHFSQRPWGGERLAQGERPAGEPVGEAWVVHEGNVISSGAHAGKTLAQVSREQGSDFLGSEVPGNRFPLLVKLLDPARWLSVQVHPNDEQARRLVGPGELGKTEAWHIVEAEPNAELILGLREGTTREQLREAMGTPQVEELVQRHPVKEGDTFYVPAGTLHAVGPGMLVYEIQQTSDTTYRAYDWGSGRELHLDESLAVINPDSQWEKRSLPASGRGSLLDSEHFQLEMLKAGDSSLKLDTRGEGFHTLTVVRGEARLKGDGWDQELKRLETAVVPANVGRYEVEQVGAEGFNVLKGSVA